MLKINEIFYSIQGESTYAGFPCVFIRFTGCNLRCKYCDTPYAYEHGEYFSIEEILKQSDRFNSELVEITGGEPLLQKETERLGEKLIELNKTVLLETNGTLDIRPLKSPIVRIVDVKCPGSGEVDKFFMPNLDDLRRTDNLKFVISNKQDFDWAIDFVNKHSLTEKVPVIFQPAFEILQPANLAEWILEKSLPIRLQIQLHKVIWGKNIRGV